MKNSNDTIGNRIRDLPACSAVPQPTAPPRGPITNKYDVIFQKHVIINHNTEQTSYGKYKSQFWLYYYSADKNKCESLFWLYYYSADKNKSESQFWLYYYSADKNKC